MSLAYIFYHEVAFKKSARPPELFIFICTVHRCDKKDRCITNQLRYTTRCPLLIKYHTQIAYLLTPCSRVLLEILTGFQLVKKFPSYYRSCNLRHRPHGYRDGAVYLYWNWNFYFSGIVGYGQRVTADCMAILHWDMWIVGMYVCMYVCMYYVCMHIYMYVVTYIYIIMCVRMYVGI